MVEVGGCGLDVWRSAMIKGRLSDEGDDAESTTIRCPPQPLYDRLVRDSLVQLQRPDVPRLYRWC